MNRLNRLLGVHSPTGHLLGTCWCKTQDRPPVLHSPSLHSANLVTPLLELFAEGLSSGRTRVSRLRDNALDDLEPPTTMKTRTIETVHELAALPIGSIILARTEGLPPDTFPYLLCEEGFWYGVDLGHHGPHTAHWFQSDLPVTLLIPND